MMYEMMYDRGLKVLGVLAVAQPSTLATVSTHLVPYHGRLDVYEVSVRKEAENT